jgi:mono/diheme cytochrome c family protein
MSVRREFAATCVALVAFVTAAIASATLPADSGTATPSQKAEKAPKYKYKDDALVYAELAKAPEKARAKRNPLATDPDAIAAGANLFDQHCAECHGELGEGSRKGPSLLKEPVQSAAPGSIFWLLTNGVVRRGMPVWSKLPEPQRWQLVAYIKSLGVPAVPGAAPAGQAPPASVDAPKISHP